MMGKLLKKGTAILLGLVFAINSSSLVLAQDGEVENESLQTPVEQVETKGWQGAIENGDI